MSGFLSSLFGSAENHDSNKLVRSKRLRGRSLRMESLEERALLSVAPADLAAVQDLFPDYEFTDNTNYIEVTNGTDYTAGSLRDAIYQAGRTTEDDVIIVRTPSVNLLDTLQINIDADRFGSVTIVGLTDSVAGLTNLSGNSQFQVISVGAGTELNLGHLNISGGKAAAGQNGGGIATVDAVLNISDIRFRSNATAVFLMPNTVARSTSRAGSRRSTTLRSFPIRPSTGRRWPFSMGRPTRRTSFTGAISPTRPTSNATAAVCMPKVRMSRWKTPSSTGTKP